jgi:hypothetical protein
MGAAVMFNFFRPFVPGFHLRPQEDEPGFNIDENGMPPRAGAWSDGGSSSSMTTSPSSGPIGLAAFRPQAELPSFNAWPWESMPVSNLNESDDKPQDTIWSTETLPSPPDIEGNVPPSPLPFPEWPYDPPPVPQRLPTTLDPLTGQRIPIHSVPSLPTTELRGTEKWPYSGVFSEMNTPPRVPSVQSPYPQPSIQNVVPRAWPWPTQASWPYAQLPNLRTPSSNDIARYPISYPGLRGAAPVEEPNVNRTNTNDEAKQQVPWQPYEQRPLSSPSTATPRSDGPSLGQRLVQSSVDTIVPGAYYQKLAREQLGAGNYLGAGVYQGAALLDAALGAATLGLSTRLSAGARAAAGQGAAIFRRAFDNKYQLLKYLGQAPKGMHWHHIVEQYQVPQFGQRAIQRVENIVAIPIEAHNRVSAFYASKQPFSEPNLVREWLRGQSFEAQYEFGLRQLKRILGY